MTLHLLELRVSEVRKVLVMHRNVQFVEVVCFVKLHRSEEKCVESCHPEELLVDLLLHDVLLGEHVQGRDSHAGVYDLEDC